MSGYLPIVIYPPDESGGRRVRVDGEILGMAHSLRDVTEFLRRAGMDDITEEDVLRDDRLAWRRAEPVARPAVSEPRTHETAPRLSHSRGRRQGAECSGASSDPA